MTPHPTTADIFPGPPTFTSFDIPHKYEYQQASGVIFVQDESGQVVSKNISAPPKRVTWGLPPDVDEVPQKPPMEIPTKNPAGEMLPRAIKELQKLLDDRPLVTKRVALNAMPPISDTIFKEATQFVGYSFKAGPWRDSLIKYGVDPRTDPKYRFYQTLMFQVDKEAFKPVPDDKQPMLKSTETNSRWARPLRHTRDDPTTHIFDGKNITANGKTWQVCDVTDPVVRDIFATDDIPATCDVYQWGWYHNGTLAKARTIMKDKMRYLFAREEPPHDDYAVLATIPHLLTKANMKTAVMNPRLYNKNVVLLANEVRNIVKTGDGSRSTKNMWISRAEKGGDPSVPTEQEGDGENEGEGDEDGGGGMVRDFVVGEGGGDFDDDGNS
jgi:general transcription factor 3C polypeptide 5 (transcription factor C subunit 1)